MEIAVNHSWAVQLEALKGLKLVASHEYSYSLTIIDKLYQMMENDRPPQVSDGLLDYIIWLRVVLYLLGHFDLFCYTSH